MYVRPPPPLLGTIALLAAEALRHDAAVSLRHLTSPTTPEHDLRGLDNQRDAPGAGE